MTLVLALCVFILVIPAISRSQETSKAVPPVTNQPKGATKSKENPQSEQTVTIELPPTINISVGGQLEMKANNEHAERHEEGTNWADRLVALFTALLVIVTAWLVYYTKNLWAATGQLVKGAESTAQKQLRAYVMIKRVEMVHITPNPSVDFHEEWIYVKFKNFGQIPATQLTYRFVIGTAENPLRSPLLGENVPQLVGVIAPNDTFTAMMKLENIDRPDERAALYIFGEVQYFDGFVPDRITRMRYMRAGGDDWLRQGRLHICQEGNEST
jgi:hypothetical protein